MGRLRGRGQLSVRLFVKDGEEEDFAGWVWRRTLQEGEEDDGAVQGNRLSWGRV